MFRSTWIRTRFSRLDATEVPLNELPTAEELNSEFSHPVLLMDDRPNRCRPVTSQLFVLQKGELHSAPAKKVSGLERVRKSKAAP
jgi:hypothetical protein